MKDSEKQLSHVVARPVRSLRPKFSHDSSLELQGLQTNLEIVQNNKIEKASYIYNIYSKVVSSSSSSSRTKKPKVLRSILIPLDVWESAKKFASFLGIARASVSVLVEKALLDYMINHANELPINATFQIILPKPEKKLAICGFSQCKLEAVGLATYMPNSKQENRIFCCQKHLQEAMEKPAIWRVDKS